MTLGTAPKQMRDVLNWPRRRKQMAVAVLDVVLAFLATWLAFTLRLDTLHRPSGAEWLVYAVAPTLAIPVFVRLGLYRAIFRYTGIAAILVTSKAVTLYGLMLLPFIWLLYNWEGIPRSLIILQPLIFLLLVVSSRALAWQWLAGRTSLRGAGLLIYGAGTAGAQTAAALAGTHHYVLLGFIDDDIAKAGRSINGVPVFPSATVEEVVSRFSVTDILLALPSASRKRRNQIIGQLQSLPVRIRSLPALADLASGRVSVDDFRELDIEDLLGREPVAAKPEFLASHLGSRVVMVTGAGGSIGSELCRQILLERPQKLILVEHSEFALYRIHGELMSAVLRNESDVRLIPVLANVCNFDRMVAICRAHHPAVVYHAAAYKHVPMVEANPAEGIMNNVFGTLTAARAAIASGAERFVLVSTDKAVRPTNIMGASKRVAELILQALSACESVSFDDAAAVRFANEDEDEDEDESWRVKTCFSMVRFGNVLGSSGSVVPLFRAQIEAGGPLTVTHPEVTRYFMTIPEAAQLVLHAGAIAQGGDLFVLDMGSPLKVVDLAKRMVALSGRTIRNTERPMGDIEITFTGLRPGEKLFEELLIGENPMPTTHPRIIRAREDFLPWYELSGLLQKLLSAARTDDVVDIREMLQRVVPGYAPKSDSSERDA